MSQRVGNPFQMFFDRRGRPLSGGSMYVGAAGLDPELNPIAAFYDSSLTLEATQPIPVIAGLISNDGNPALIYVDSGQYSLRVRDADGAEVFFTASASLGEDSFQPLDSDLTAIAALATTSFGRNVLTQANAAGLRAYAGITDSLPLIGGTVTGNITRSGAGGHAYAADAAYPRIRIFVTPNGAADPRTATGDIWLEEEA